LLDLLTVKSLIIVSH